jgi:hypothetical protein
MQLKLHGKREQTLETEYITPAGSSVFDSIAQTSEMLPPFLSKLNFGHSNVEAIYMFKMEIDYDCAS